MAKHPEKRKQPEAPPELDEIMRTILKAPPQPKKAPRKEKGGDDTRKPRPRR